MENNEKMIIKEDKIIVSNNGNEFIFPVYPVETARDYMEKMEYWTKKLKLAKINSDAEGLKKANKMLELLTAGKISIGPTECQMYYISKGLPCEPTRSGEERSEARANRRR